jgi:hypothetical protein
MNLKHNKKYYIIYKTTNLINNKTYIGAHATDDLNDGYLGSGIHILRAINKYGEDNFRREILGFYNDIESMYEAEKEYVNEEYIARKDTYNLVIGGSGGWNNKNTTIVKDKDGNVMRVSTNDPRYISGELIGHTSRLVTVKDKNGKHYMVSVDDERYKSGELVHLCTGRIPVKDNYGNTTSVTKDDPRWKTGEICSTTKDCVMVYDKKGKIIRVSKDDENFKNGLYVSIHKNKVCVKDNDGNILKVDIDDPRYLSGELVSNMVGMVHARLVSDKTKIITVSRNDPRWKTGEIVGNRHGLRRINNGAKEVDVFEDEIDKYISEGWIKGKLK